MKKSLIVVFVFVHIFSFTQVIDIPDSNFMKTLVSIRCVDTNGDNLPDADADINNDSLIQVDEAELVTSLFLGVREIDSLNGINYFVNLKRLDCIYNTMTKISLSNLPVLQILNITNNELTQLTLSNLPSLQYLNCNDNKLTQLTFSNLPVLQFIYCNNNSLNYLDINGLFNLQTIDCTNNFLYQLNVSNLSFLTRILCSHNSLVMLEINNLPSLRELICDYNRLNQLIVANLPSLETLWCNDNNLKKLDVYNLPSLKSLICHYNYWLSQLKLENLPSLERLNCISNDLTQLDLSNFTSLKFVNCSKNPLSKLFIKIGGNELLEFYGPSFIDYVCADENRIVFFRSKMTIGEINSYCSFTPGGKFYTINGSAIFDEDNNSCDLTDNFIDHLRYNITNGTIKSSFISNKSGQYNIAVQEGTYTITPLLEYPQYFNTIPSSISITVPSASDSVTQNFCFTSKEMLRNIDIAILPISKPARPGFEAKYKIIISNRGNRKEYGTLNFRFDETVLNFMSSDNIPTIQSDGLLAWEFVNLRPFETRIYSVTLNVNKPTDTPSVNSGDILKLTASILDNVFILNNTVVGSYDPNDKTCLEGNIITPDLIGKYVHYLIRFENTGTYEAENIVVKDIFNTAVFDVSTLEITDASHSAYTRIKSNAVEFIFEKIQLPFDDANNDGYIAFKIKTKPTLKLGDVLKNKANIYFDYNYPIKTNEAISVVSNTVSTHNSLSSSDIVLYPNPALDFVKFDSDCEIIKVDIYDAMGKVLQSSEINNNQVDVRELPLGTYVLNLFSKKGVSSAKLIKNK